MGISKAEKAAYNDEIKDVKKEVETLNLYIKELIIKQRKLPKIKDYYLLEIVNIQLKINDLYIRMSDLSMEMLGIKNDTFLNNARKGFYKVLQYTEDIIGKDMDRSLKENDDYLAKIALINPAQILEFITKIHSGFSKLRDKIGESSKWKWSFVELFSRVAVITKNITKFSDVAKFRDPRYEFYKDLQKLMKLCKETLSEAAKQYRGKYELSGKARDDLKASIDLLGALRKIHVLFGEDEEATKLKNTIDAARLALEAEDKSKEKESIDKKKKG